MTRRRRSSRPRPASRSTSGTWPTRRPRRPASSRSRPNSGRSTCSSTMPASPATAMFHKMTFDQWSAVMRTNLDSMFAMTRPVIEGMRDRGARPDRQHLVDQRPEGPDGPGQLFGLEGRDHRLHQGAGAGECAEGHHGQLHLPGLHRHRHGGGGAGEGARGDHRARSRSAGSARPRRSPRWSSTSPRTTPPS